MMQLNSNQIAEIIPHRYPFALVDRIVDGEVGKWAKGIKCVSVGEPVFCGHFPQEHVLPGVLILEAMARWAPSPFSLCRKTGVRSRISAV